MIRMRLRIAFVATSLWCVGLFRSAFALDGNCPFSQYGHDVWQTSEGLPNNKVQAIAQTPEGYLWLATAEGLARFNGMEFTGFSRRHQPQLHGDNVVALATAKEGSLWIATADGLCRWRRGRFEASPLQVRGLLFALPLVAAKDGAVWMGGNRLRRLTENGAESFRMKPEESVLSVCPSGEGGLWVATAHRVGRWRDGVFMELKELSDASGEGSFTSLCEDRHGNLWIGSTRGLIRFAQGKVAPFKTEDELSHAEVRVMLEDREGNLWIGTSYGLNRFSNGRLVRDSEVLPNEFIFSLFEDREGSLWVGTHQGLHRLRDRPVRVYGAKDGLFHEVVQGIVEDSRGKVSVGTWLGGVYELENGRFARLAAPSLLNASVKCLYADREDTLWVGTAAGL